MAPLLVKPFQRIQIRDTSKIKSFFIHRISLSHFTLSVVLKNTKGSEAPFLATSISN